MPRLQKLKKKKEKRMSSGFYVAVRLYDQRRRLSVVRTLLTHSTAPLFTTSTMTTSSVI